MASQNESGFRTFELTGSAGISAFQAVNVNNDGTISACANGVKGIGVVQEALGTIPATQYGKVKLWSAPGTFMLIASNTSVTAGSQYSIITGGFVGTVTGGLITGANAPFLLALTTASQGSVAEFSTNFLT